MNLLTPTEFANLAGVHRSSISRALNPKNGKEPKLDYYKGTKKINLDSVKARSYLENIPPERLSKKIDIRTTFPSGLVDIPVSEDFNNALGETQKANAKKIIEEAEFKKQQRIEKELKNAVRRGELIELEAINQTIMTWFDKWLQANKRGFNSGFEQFMRDAFKIFENEQRANEKNYKPHEVTRASLKREWTNLFESWADRGKENSIKKLTEIQMEQAKK